MDFKPSCKSCLYLSMVLQRPVGCEQHATASAWSAAGGPVSKPRADTPVALPAAEASQQPDDRLLNPDLVVLFTHAEYQRLCALRARVQEQRGRDPWPDDLSPDRGCADGGGGAAR